MTDIDKIDTQSPEFQNALQVIEFTRRSLYLTGKAGTGKSTFLRYVAATTKKKFVILAPTGIAAINAGGVTLHSFFKIPFCPLLPGDSRFNPRNIKKTQKYNSAKQKLLREVELIIIDEISMVRANIIDFIDNVLRVYNNNMREPFGGKQLLLVGDIYQLEPVVKEEDRKLLSPYYAGNFFFNARVFQQMQLISIELRKVYRQNDPSFIRVLDHIRANELQHGDLERLNRQVGAKLDEDHSSLSITLSTLRDTVDYINQQRLDQLEGEATLFRGCIEGEFPENSLPTPIELLIKPGAQVIFVKNDMERRWVNGTLGTVTAFDKETENGLIYVSLEDGDEVAVEPASWSNVHYHFNEKEEKIEEEEVGRYIQFPLRLAWAITVHKSQGLTFKQVKIDFTGGVFAGGQAYVALSRCTSLEGISLKEPIRKEEIFVKNEVKRFASHYNDNNAINSALSDSKADKQYADAAKAFDEGDMQGALDNFFLAIHSRYDIEKPSVKRLLRRKLNVVNLLKEENKRLVAEKEAKLKFLMKLSIEYFTMGKECETEHMTQAAIRNYEKALKLYPDHLGAKRRLEKIKRHQ